MTAPTFAPYTPAEWGQHLRSYKEAEWERWWEFAREAAKALELADVRMIKAATKGDFPGGFSSVRHAAALWNRFGESRFREYSPRQHAGWYLRGMSDEAIEKWIEDRQGGVLR